MPTAVEMMTERTGYAPLYQISTKYGLFQPVITDAEGWVRCPAEGRHGWGVAGDELGFIPVRCPANGVQHTHFPDPVTARRMRRALRQHDRTGAWHA